MANAWPRHVQPAGQESVAELLHTEMFLACRHATAGSNAAMPRDHIGSFPLNGSLYKPFRLAHDGTLVNGQFAIATLRLVVRVNDTADLIITARQDIMMTAVKWCQHECAWLLAF